MLQKIAIQNELELISTEALLGGDINSVYRLETDKGDFVVKCNDVQKFPGMFHAEHKGLKLLRDSNSFIIPEVVANNQVENTAYLLMEYLPAGVKSTEFWRVFGEKLANLHKTTNVSYGLDHDNYIGSLPQYNSKHKRSRVLHTTASRTSIQNGSRQRFFFL